MEKVNVCPIHDIDNGNCGGPHNEIYTDIGWEVVRLGERPLGNRIPVTPEAEHGRYSTNYKRIYE